MGSVLPQLGQQGFSEEVTFEQDRAGSPFQAKETRRLEGLRQEQALHRKTVCGV